MKSAMRLRVSLLLLCAVLKISQASCDKDECAESVTQKLTVNTTAVVFGSDPQCNLSTGNNVTGEGSLTGLTPGVVYTVFIGCFNCCHQITTKPETVVGLIVTETTTSSISLSWTPLLNSSSYRVNYTNGTTNSDVLTVTESEITVTGLTAGVKYSFTVRAVADDNTTEGDSATITGYTKPGKVGNPNVSRTDSSISLTWSPPPGEVLEYRVFWHNGGTMMDNSTTSPSAVLPNLISGTTYTIRIVAVNGAKELGEPHILTTVTNPAAVKNLTVTAVTSSSVSLSWIEPDGNASSYLVRWTLGGKNFSNTSIMTSFTIEDLTPGTQYSINVSAVADSTNTGVETSTTTFTRPVKPVDIVVNQRTTDKMNISWTLSKGRVDHFMVNISNEELMYSNSSTTTDNTFLFTGLRPGRVFAITVTAVAGAFREMSDQTSFATYPTPPGDIVDTQRTNSSLHLSWGTPRLMDDAPNITYHITYQSQTEGGAAQNETSNDENVTLSSLLSGTNYTITVQTVGPQSLKSSERVTSAFTSPNPVFNLECSHKSTTSVTVAWSAPQGAQDYYKYFVQTNGSAGALINETTRTDLSGLEPGTRYNISVRTIATEGIQSMDEFTTCFTMPTAVLNLSVENVTTTSVQLSWHKQNDYKSTYTYMVRALLDDILVHNDTTNTQTYNFTGLDPGHFYTFEVITKLDGINSSEASTSTYTIPAVVTNILTTGSMDSLSVNWTLAEGQVDSYSVLLHSDKDPGKNSTDLSNSTVNEVFEGLKAGVEYCVEVITLRGPFQNSSPRFCNATFPRPPGPITVQSQTVDSINFTWSLPEDMDHMQYNFSVSTFNGAFLTTENHFLLNNLLSGSPYNISVVTVGALNYESTAQRSQTYTRPHPVTVLENMTDITTDTVTLFWTQRESKPHYSYEVKSSISADPEVIVDTTKTFTGLDSGSSYSFTITTQTEDGTQAAPVTVSFFTRPHGVRQLQAETLNTTAVHLFFTGPLEYKPEYSYRAETSGCDTHRNETFAGNDTVISELTPGTKCTFCVVVRADDGTEGEATCTSQYTKPETVQPRISSQGSNSSVLVSWDKPPGRVESFIVQLNSTSESEEKTVLGSSDTSILFDGLSAGQIYRAMVTSQSGNFREPSEVVTSATFPNPPGPIEVLKKTNSSIDIEWGEAPRMSNVSFFYNLTIVSSEGGENISLNNTSHAFTSLRSGTPYNISVVTVGALAFQSELVQIHRVTTRPFDVSSLKVSGNITEDTLIATWAKPDQYQESYTFNLTLQGPGGRSTNVSKDNRFRFTGLDPGSQYSISVTTETSDGTQSDPRRTSACTKASPVLSLKCKGPNRPTAELVLDWNCPPGDYSGFQVRVGNVTNDQSSRDCTRTVSNLRHYTNYSVAVETQSCGPTSDRRTITCQTGITDPPAPENPQLVQITDKNHFRFSLQINSSLLNNTNGPIRYVGVLVTDSSPDNSNFRNYLGKTYNQWKEEKTQVYLATVKETSLPTRSAETQLTIDVGDGSSWKGYTNGPLTPNRKYQFAIVLFTDLNLEDQLVNGSLSLVSSTLFSFSIDLPMNPTVVGLAVGATLGIFCILFIVLLGFIIYWKRMSKKESQEVQVVTLSTPVRVEEFEDYYKRQKADSNCGFAEEFEELKVVGTGQAKTHALAPENKPKNRYNNVLPYDSSRVKLSIIHGSPHDDYINANYMPGYNSSKEFIAAQGPLPQTVNEFWRMIWEKNVQTLVMLTRCNEQGRVKCEQYWEHGTKHFENIIVTTTSEIPLKDWTIRDFDVKNVKTAETRPVRHFHFTAWPDHGVPETTELLISFRHLVREHMDQYSRHSPAVVHCSAGVGRTGTLIAIDRLINQIERENLVDVYGIVRDLRMHRPLMVQTEDQYVFLNQCAMDIIRSRTGTNVDLIYQNMAALSIYENVEPKKGFNRNGYNNA